MRPARPQHYGRRNGGPGDLQSVHFPIFNKDLVGPDCGLDFVWKVRLEEAVDSFSPEHRRTFAVNRQLLLRNTRRGWSKII